MQYYRHKIENLLVVKKIVTIHYFEFDKNFRSRGEAHDFWELVYADSGPLICKTENGETTLNEGEIIFHKPNEFHIHAADGKTAPKVFIMSFESHSEAVRFFENKRLKLDKRDLLYVYSIIEESKRTFLLPHSDPDLKKMIPKTDPALGGMQLIKNMLEILLIDIMRGESERENPDAVFLLGAHRERSVTQQVNEYLKAHISENITINDISNALHYNRSYLFRRFKADTGDTIMNCFAKIKIQKAEQMLVESPLSVAQISDSLGFESTGYFIKTFKRITRMTPLTYRKLHRK